VAVTNEQVVILMKELSKGVQLAAASAKAGMTRQTGAKYRRLGRLPSELTVARTWRTRDNPFAEVWSEVEEKLRGDEGLQAKTLFDWLVERYPRRWEPGQLRTLQRHIRHWRVVSGKASAQELFFPQRHRAGEAMQVDFTHTGELELTLSRAPYAPLLCHPILPYSGWEWATVCQSESILSLRAGIQEAVFRLGGVTEWCQTDNSTGATHRIGKEGGKRPFNQDYLDLMAHLGMKPRTIEVGKKEQNGSVEARNGAFKRMLDQQLRLRGSRDFADESEFISWLAIQLDRANARRSTRVREELKTMRPLAASRLPEFVVLRGLPVSSHATINVKENIYSVPPSLKNHRVDARVYEKRLEVWYGNTLMWSTPRLVGKSRHAINYRHVIWSLVRKPGAFARYHFREDLFPTLTFRRAYEALQRQHAGIKADATYLRILHLAASTLESEVEAAIALLLEQGAVPTPDAVKELVGPEKPTVPKLDEPRVDLSDFDALLHEVAL
jgi:hypothetical protein